MHNKYRLKIDQMGLPAGTEFEERFESKIYGRIYSAVTGDTRRVVITPGIVEYIPDIFEPVIEMWKPEEGGEYWTCDGVEVWALEWNGDSADYERLQNGLIFRTEEQANEAVKRTRKALMDYQTELAEEK